jgi:hypothetical protein
VLVGELEGVWGAEGEDEGEAPVDGVGDADPVKEEVAVGLADGVIEAVPLEDTVPVGLLDGEPAVDGLTDADAPTDSVRAAEGLTDAVADGLVRRSAARRDRRGGRARGAGGRGGGCAWAWATPTRRPTARQGLMERA